MASKRERPNGWEYVVKRAGLLDKPIYLTFASEAEGDAYVDRLEKLLDRGIVPAEHRTKSDVTTIAELVTEYCRDAHPSAKDVSALNTVVESKGETTLISLNAAWVDAWVTDLKRVDCIAPATIRAKIGALARCTDWGMRKQYLLMPDHPFRTLPDGYAQYTELDSKLAGVTREDIERDRRLEPGQDGQKDEHDRILAVIEGGVLARKLRPYSLPNPRALRCLYILALESAMRLREMYTLTMDQVQINRLTVFLDKTKNGDKRQVPLSSVAVAELRSYMEVRDKTDNRLFPWWDGDTSEKGLRRMTDYLSKIYIGIFEQAGCVDLKFHDLRHEATSRLFERTQLSETQIMRVTGHKSQRMLLRYANLRGSDLAAQLW